MTDSRKHIIFKGAGRINSFLKSIIVLSLAVVFFPHNSSFAQVISNNGAAITVSSGIIVTAKDASNISGAVLSNAGTINLSGNYTSTAYTNGPGTFRIGGDWTNTGGSLSGINTVVFNGFENQLITRIGGETFYNLSIENSGAPASRTVTLSNLVTVTGKLFMKLGNVNAGANKLFLSNFAAASLDYSSSTRSRILGKFERGINEQGTYLFPLGTATHYNPANLTTNSTPAAGTILSEYFTAPTPGNAGLPIPDPPVEVATAYPDGYWSLTANSFSSANFNINLRGSGFIDTIFDITRVIKRTAGGNWIVDGIHSDAIDSVVFRNNLTLDISPSGTQFALGRPRPLITFQPRDTIVCERAYPVFRVSATGANPLNYRWYKVPGISLFNGTDYSGVNTPYLTINNVDLLDAGGYYCVIRDRYGNTSTSNTANLTVNKIPVATATNPSQLEECSGVSFDNIVLGISYGVPGTTYLWSRNNPSEIITGIPLSGTGLNIGDMLSGSFTNTSDAPITITFSITPVGPGPTYCTGATINATVRVNPVPKVFPVNLNNLKRDSSICFGGTTAIRLTSPTQMTSGSIIFDYGVTPTGNPGVVTGIMTSGIALPVNYEIRRAYGNLSDTIQSVSFTVTPKVSNAVCASGIPVVSQIRVHPKPARRIAIVVPLTCDGGSDATLMAVTSRGTGPLEVFWQGPYGYTNNSLFTLTNRIGGNYRVTITDNLGCDNYKDTVVQGAFIDSYIYAFPKPINPNGTQYEVTCPGSGNGDLQFAVNSGGTPTYEYWIMRNSTDISTAMAHNYFNSVGVPFTLSNLIEGRYTLIIKDANGCFNIRTTGPGIYEYTEAYITEPVPITVTFDKYWYGGYNVRCRNYADGKAWVKTISGGNGGYTYQWERPLGNPIGSSDTIYNVSAGWYYLTTTDTKGCTKLDSVLISQPEGMDLVSAQLKTSPDGNFNVSCNGSSDGKITLNITGGSGTYQYHWDGPDGLVTTAVNQISGLRAGHYSATVTDLNNCSLDALDTTLIQPAILDVVPVPLLAPDGNNINCNGGIGTVSLAVTGGSVGNYKFNWSVLSGGSGVIREQKDQNALTAGNYRVVVSDSNHCETTRDVTLTQPTALATVLVPTHITCQSALRDNGSINLTVTGGAVPYSYSWTTVAGSGITPGAVNQTGLTEGYYKVTVTDFNGCQKVDSVRVNPPPDLSYSSLPSLYNGFNISCFGMANGSINITPVGGQPTFIYNWSTVGGSGLTPGAANQTGLTAGQYSVTIIDANSCTATGSFTLSEPFKLDMTLLLSNSTNGRKNINCAGSSTGSIDVNAINNAGTVNYLWSDGATGKLRTNIPAGSYKVILTDQNNCLADSTIILTEPDSIKTRFDVTEAFCPDSPDGQIQLTVTGGVIISDYIFKWSDNSTNQNLSNILKGKYRVIVTDANNCSVKDSVKMKPLNETCLVIPNAISPNNDNINDVWNIGMKELYPQMEIKIFNRWGELLWKSEKGYPHPWDGKGKGTQLPIDSYHYIIDLHNGTKPVIGSITIVR